MSTNVRIQSPLVFTDRRIIDDSKLLRTVEYMKYSRFNLVFHSPDDKYHLISNVL